MNRTAHRQHPPRGSGNNAGDQRRPGGGDAGTGQRKPRLVCPPLGSTPAGLTSGRSHRRPIPYDLLKQASQRLEVMALLAVALWILSTVLYHVVDLKAAGVNWMSFQATDGLVGIGAVVSIALFFYVRHSSRDPRFILDLGLAYMVLNAALVGLILHWEPNAHASTLPMLSWNGVLVLMFAATLPNDAVKTAVAGLLVVSMNPIGMLIARARSSWAFDSALTAWTMHYPDFLLVGVSLVISRIVTGLGHQVARAREMGSYELGELIGRGGMGEVYKATHRMLARPAAVKLIRPELLAARNGEQAHIAVERFHREATAAAQLRSPHTVGLYDFGTTDDGTLYFAMELLDGMDLESLVTQSGPLPAARVVHILLQACDSLAEAHAAGLVHRDIKPANIHIGRFGLRDDFVKVLDFGLVTSGGAASGRSQMATLAGTTPGTPAYMSPEMALGEKVDGRTDIYALGCVAYYLLTGQLVFPTGNAVQSLIKRLHDEPVPPSQRSEIPIPADLEAIVMTCIRKDPASRPTSAGALARSLAAVNVTAWTNEQARHWWAVHQPEKVSGSTPRAAIAHQGLTAMATPLVTTSEPVDADRHPTTAPS
jgi:eukaryotic-like serine/threonine-protein kinase